MPPDLERGARNLLQQCARARPGERLLLVGERCARPFFDPALCAGVAKLAKTLGLETEIVLAEPGADAAHFPPAVIDAMRQADIVIFFSRLGDQVRFVESPGPGRKIMTYTLTLEHLGSEFASVDYRAMLAVHDSLLAAIRGASRYRIETGSGTDLRGQIRSSVMPGASAVTEFSLDLFPVMIFPPVHFHALEGRLVLEHFLLSSSTRAYADSVLRLDSPIGVAVENSRMTRFDGDSRLVDRVRAQLERAAAITGGDPYRLNSWHTGINPYTFYADDPYADLERWGTAAFGSPRYTHIHAAGHDPGDISIQLFDASISLDDSLYWKRGRFLFLDRPDLRRRFETPPRPDSSLQMSIGI